ncbi:uncharacterized protein LOC144873871 [Branchiostoma floridae x Branchiostoma japonicum]
MAAHHTWGYSDGFLQSIRKASSPMNRELRSTLQGLGILKSDKRGGVVAVYTKENIPSKQMDVAVPTELECVWVHIRPHWLPRSVSSIALCAVYHPPNSPHEEALLDFLSKSIDDIRRQYPDVGVVVLGDLNRLDVAGLCSQHSLTQLVKVPTRDNAILDQILASHCLASYYQEPTTDPPIGDSDHNCVIWEGSPTPNTGNETQKRQVRPLRESDMRAFGCWITQHTWDEVYCAVNTQEKYSAFYTTLLSAVDSFFPFGLSSKKAFYKNKIEHLKMADPRKWYKAIKELTNSSKGQLRVEVPGVPSSSPKSVANAINMHLAAASQQHAPLQLKDLPAYLPAPAPPPIVSFWDMWHRLKQVKIGKATGSDNISPRIVREFAFELSQPLCDIINTSLCQGVVPEAWRDADVIPVPKEMPPSLSKLRPISLTSVFAKVCEGIITDWCLKDILPSVDPRQYGSLRGRSTTHYLTLLTHKLLETADKRSHVSTLVLTDFTRAFDSVHHQTAVNKLIELGVRPSVVPWIISFLTERRQRVKYQGEVSEWQTLTCGVPQGTKLGPLIFLVLVNDAVPADQSTADTFKYVDDLSLLEPRHVLSAPTIQDDIDGLARWTDDNHMALNPPKCKVLLFCVMKYPPPPPVITVGPTQLEVVEFAQTRRTVQNVCSLPQAIPDLQKLAPTMPWGDLR